MGLGLFVIAAAFAAAYVFPNCVLACPADPEVCQHATEQCLASVEETALEWMLIGLAIVAIGVWRLARVRARLGRWTVHPLASEEHDW